VGKERKRRKDRWGDGHVRLKKGEDLLVRGCFRMGFRCEVSVGEGM
jgi:hypothetical protein